MSCCVALGKWIPNDYSFMDNLDTYPTIESSVGYLNGKGREAELTPMVTSIL